MSTGASLRAASARSAKKWSRCSAVAAAAQGFAPLGEQGAQFGARDRIDPQRDFARDGRFPDPAAEEDGRFHDPAAEEDVLRIGDGGRRNEGAAMPLDGDDMIVRLAPKIAPIEANLMRYGPDRRYARVRACEVPVLALDDPTSGACEKLSQEIERAKAQDRAEAIVLGCAGMADLAASLGRRHALPVIDGVASAVKLAEALVSLGHATSKLGPYARPLPKACAGAFAGMGGG